MNLLIIKQLSFQGLSIYGGKRRELGTALRPKLFFHNEGYGWRDYTI